MWQAWTNGILGLWLAVVPFLAMDTLSVKLNNALVGLVVAIVAWYVPKEKSWQRWSAMILGVWVFIASFFPGLLEGSPYLWNNLISGLLIAIAGFAVLGKISVAKHA
jgi:hypothetical protein